MTTAGGYGAAGEHLRALSAPTRWAIVTELAAGERCMHELVDKLGVTRAAAGRGTHHVRPG